MSILNQLYKTLPDYYPSMYLDGYTPSQLLYSVKRKMMNDYYDR